MQEKAGTLRTGVSLVLTDDAAIEVRAEGAGPAIVLLPSLGRGIADFNDIVPALVDNGYRVLRPEPRGVGRSRGPMSGNTLHHFAADIASIIRQDGSAPCVIAGHAFGGKVACTVAANHREVVRALVLIAGTGNAEIDPDIGESIGVGSDPSLPREKRRDHLVRAFFAEGNDPAEWLDGWHPETMAMQREAEKATAPDAYVGGGDAPVLDIQAEADAVVGESERSARRETFAERVTVVVIRRAGHALLPEQPAQVAAAIHDYIQKL